LIDNDEVGKELELLGVQPKNKTAKIV